MLHIALWEPEIPPNTGNIARLCAATGASLHLIGRLGFRLDERSLRRAGLDYWPEVSLFKHADLAAFHAALADGKCGAVSGAGYCLTTKGERAHSTATYAAGDYLLFGGEARGLPPSVIEDHGDRALRIPMPAGKVRSLNLATAVGIVLYEALRQLHAW
jgi:tRNA (cytidine/uridine-2'-O-)-methyltransferase